MTGKNEGDLRIEFLLAEHGYLRENLRQASADLSRMETIVPVAVAAIYAWLYGVQANRGDLSPVLWWIPPLLACFGAWRQYLRYKSLWGYHDYLRAIEGEIYGRAPAQGRDFGFGWETYWLERVHPLVRVWKWRRSPHGLMRMTFWFVLVACTMGLAAVETLIVDRSNSNGCPELAKAVRAEVAKPPSPTD